MRQYSDIRYGARAAKAEVSWPAGVPDGGLAKTRNSYVRPLTWSIPGSHVQPTGFFRQKTKAVIGMAQGLVDRFDGEVPGPIEQLVTLPGVGRKTANVVRSVALGLPGFPVDTHVGRLVRRLDITQLTDPVKVEAVVDALVPSAERGLLSLRLILHGRRVCVARRPRCGDCVLADFCPSAGTG